MLDPFLCYVDTGCVKSHKLGLEVGPWALDGHSHIAH